MRQLEQDMAKMMNHAAQESGAPDHKEFENAINQGADAFTKQLEESGIPPGDFLKQLLADVMAEEGESAGAAAGAGARVGPSAGGSSRSATGAEKATAPESFNDAIQRTINRMKESGDKAMAAVTEDGGISEDMLMQLLKGLEAGVGNGGDDLDLTQMIAGVMEQFSNKEMLYEPMKELDAKWGPWLKENKGKVPAEDMKRYEKQAKLVTEIVAKFEEEEYTDEDPKYRQAVWEKMQEVCFFFLFLFLSFSLPDIMLIPSRCKRWVVPRKNLSRIPGRRIWQATGLGHPYLTVPSSKVVV